MNIDELIEKRLQTEIIEIIKEQCRKYREFSRMDYELYYEPYTVMRNKYMLTYAVISGFAPNRLNIEGLTSIDINYGLNEKLCQPELICENGIFHIYSKGSDLCGKKIIERSKKYNTNIDEYPLFFVIIFDVSKEGYLNSVEIRIPNSEGKMVESYFIYQRAKLVVLSA